MKSTVPVDLTGQFNAGNAVVSEYASSLIAHIKTRITEDKLAKITKSVFYDWQTTSLVTLIDIANRHRDYGDKDMLMEQYLTLKERFETVEQLFHKKEETFKWLKVFKTPAYYTGVEDILHLALCSFTKSPLEATAETIGSVINHHGTKVRQSLHASTLSTEVQVAWNGPNEFTPEATKLIKESLEEYFKDKHTGIRFFRKSALKFVSSTLSAYMTRPSRIRFGSN